MRIGLAANRLHHDTSDAALFRLLREIEPRLRDTLRPTLLIVGRTFDAIRRDHADIELIEQPLHINDPAFAEAAAQQLLKLIQAKQKA